MTYEESVINAKNKAVEYGLYSKEYADAIRLMNEIWLSQPKSKTEKVINFIAKKVWQIRHKRY